MVKYPIYPIIKCSLDQAPKSQLALQNEYQMCWEYQKGVLFSKKKNLPDFAASRLPVLIRFHLQQRGHESRVLFVWEHRAMHDVSRVGRGHHQIGPQHLVVQLLPFWVDSPTSTWKRKKQDCPFLTLSTGFQFTHLMITVVGKCVVFVYSAFPFSRTGEFLQVSFLDFFPVPPLIFF